MDFYDALFVIKRWARRRYLLLCLLGALITHICVVAALTSNTVTNMVGITTRVKAEPFVNLATLEKGASARFGSTSRPCTMSETFFMNLIRLYGSKSSATSILNDGNEYACFIGKNGELVIQLRKLTWIKKIKVEAPEHGKMTRPKDFVIHGSQDNSHYKTLASARLGKDSKPEEFVQIHADEPVKFLKIQILSNWGGDTTIIKRIAVAGEEVN